MQFQMSSHVFAVDFSTSMTWLAYSTIIVLTDLKLMTLASLKVTPEEVLTTLNQQYTCVGSRRIFSWLSLCLITTPALKSRVIDGVGVVSIDKEHGEVEDIFANLFCCQVHRLTKGLLDNGWLKGRALAAPVKVSSQTP